HLVPPGYQVDDLVRAGLARHLLRREIGLDVRHGDGCARYDAAARILDNAAQRRAIDLRRRHRRSERQCGDERTRAVEQSLHELSFLPTIVSVACNASVIE